MGLLISLVPSLASAASWLCVAEIGTGIVGVTGNYQSLPMEGGDNFLVRPPLEGDAIVRDEDGDLPHYVVMKVGEGELLSQIYADIVENGNFVISKIGRAEFAFNAKLKKFVVASYYSFLAEEEGGYTPLILIGKCSRLD